MHKYLASPYQENLYVDIEVEAASPSTLKIRERIDYTCRQAAGGLPDSIEWQAASREVLSVEELKIGAGRPPREGGGCRGERRFVAQLGTRGQVCR